MTEELQLPATGWTLSAPCPAPAHTLAAYWNVAEQRHIYRPVPLVATGNGPPPYETQQLIGLVFAVTDFVPAPHVPDYCGWAIERPGLGPEVYCPYGHVEA